MRLNALFDPSGDVRHDLFLADVVEQVVEVAVVEFSFLSFDPTVS